MLRVVEEAARTDTGRQRRTNEDAYLARAPIFVVADGMGGAQAGEVAAQMAAGAFETFDRPSGDAEQTLRETVKEANREIWRLAHEDAGHSGMGTTLTAALVGEADVSIAHVGDSRAYLYRDGELSLLTRDHSLVEELRRRGQLTESEAEQHPQRSIITRALGPEPEVEVDTHTHSARDDDVFLLCSDGLTTMVTDGQIEEILGNSGSLGEAVSRLVSSANEYGGKDNVTAIAFRVGDSDRSGRSRARSEAEQTMIGTRPPVADETRVVGGKAETGGRRAPRRRLVAALAIALAAGLGAGGLYGVRQAYFVGTDDQGLVTIYRGLPYDLPANATLYSKQYVSAVPAGGLKPFLRRRLLDHQLRSRSDAFGVVRRLEGRQR